MLQLPLCWNASHLDSNTVRRVVRRAKQILVQYSIGLFSSIPVTAASNEFVSKRIFCKLEAIFHGTQKKKPGGSDEENETFKFQRREPFEVLEQSCSTHTSEASSPLPPETVATLVNLGRPLDSQTHLKTRHWTKPVGLRLRPSTLIRCWSVAGCSVVTCGRPGTGQAGSMHWCAKDKTGPPIVTRC